jgi:hypothetical protein
MHTEGQTFAVKALAAAEEPLETMMRRIITEFKAKPAETNRSYQKQPNDLKRIPSQFELDAYRRGRQDARMVRPPYQDRQVPQPSTQSREQGRYTKPPPTSAPSFRQRQNPQAHGGQQQSTRQRYGPPPDSSQRTQDRRAFSAAETANEDEEDAPFDSLEHHAYSASRFDGADHEDYHDEDCYAMMGRRDYDFNGSYDEEEDDN